MAVNADLASGSYSFWSVVNGKLGTNYGTSITAQQEISSGAFVGTPGTGGVTTVALVLTANPGNGTFWLQFTNTSREGNVNVANNPGGIADSITNVYMTAPRDAGRHCRRGRRPSQRRLAS